MGTRTLVVGESLVDLVQCPDGSTQEHVGGSPWESVNGKSLTWVKNAIWPSSAAPSDARVVVR